jgi:hypothetical protein
VVSADLVREAHMRVLSLRPAPSDPVQLADWKTRRADARTALCLACGVAPEHITSEGSDVSPAAYASSRRSWVRHLTQWGYSEMFDHLDEVFASWRRCRPELLDGDDWLAEALAAHTARYPEGCDRPACDFCQP